MFDTSRLKRFEKEIKKTYLTLLVPIISNQQLKTYMIKNRSVTVRRYVRVCVKEKDPRNSGDGFHHHISRTSHDTQRNLRYALRFYLLCHKRKSLGTSY